MMEGLAFAQEIGLPLNTHLIVHWGGTLLGDDSDGNLFANFRYLLDKRFRRKFGIALTGIGCGSVIAINIPASHPKSPTLTSCCICRASTAQQQGETLRNSSPSLPNKFSTTEPSSSPSLPILMANIF